MTVQLAGGRNVKRQLEYYNLDVIISVGYRVKSAKGTRFRQWATARLKDYLVQGYAINEKRLAQKNQEVRTLKDGIRILSRAFEDQADGSWLRQFAGGLELLDDYDHENLDVKGLTKRSAAYPTLEEYMDIINSMKSQFESNVFGKEKDQSFNSAISHWLEWKLAINTKTPMYTPGFFVD